QMLWVKESLLRQTTPAVRNLYRDFTVFKKSLLRFGCPTNFNHLTVSWYINEPKPNKRPNVYCDDNFDFYALSRIQAGDELSVDYSTYSDPMPDWLMK
ncbi:MAG TPA: hypothetical protein VH255_09035, partial [Verrucomicrobiae bacterium]|nr:hypothetical protein [Verrucomicrobiae bacterium]